MSSSKNVPNYRSIEIEQEANHELFDSEQSQSTTKDIKIEDSFEYNDFNRKKSFDPNRKLKSQGVNKDFRFVRNEVDSSQAWLTLGCIFIINATTLGTLKIQGLIFEKIVAEKYYNREDASWPISTASSVQNLSGIITPILSLKMSWRSIEILQTLLFVIANVGAFFSRNLILDILCIGIIQGIALGLRYNMNVVINNEYFHKYRATAAGISIAGSTIGVFVLKPLISYILDTGQGQFRYAYLALAMIVLFNVILGLFIRKPREPIRSGTPESQDSEQAFNETNDDEIEESLSSNLKKLIKNPNLHFIWIMQTIYFLISRTYTIFIVDYGIDKGFSQVSSRNFLNFWVYGELGGRLILGAMVDSRVLSLKLNLIIVNLLLALAGLAPLFTEFISITSSINTSSISYWFIGISFTLVAALSSLINMMIIPFGQEYLGKKNVPWSFAIGSVITGIFLLFRPFLIGLSRDYYKSYDPLIIFMSSGPILYAILFCLLEPLLRKYKL